MVRIRYIQTGKRRITMEAINNIHFTDEAIAGLIIQSVLMMILPVILVIIWKIKTRERMLPIIIGGVTWLLFAIILKLAPAYLLLYADNPAAKTISGNIWYTMILSGALAGIFEETGRFIAFKTVLRKYEHRRSSLSYGIGHGGFESVYIGFQFFSFVVIGIMINSGMGDQLINGANDAQIATMISQLTQESQVTIGECLLGVFERIPSIVTHIAFSVLVFAAAREKKYIWLYPLAIFLHALTDFSTVFYSAGIVPLWAMELIITCFAAVIAYIASRVYKKLKAE